MPFLLLLGKICPVSAVIISWSGCNVSSYCHTSVNIYMNVSGYFFLNKMECRYFEVLGFSFVGLGCVQQ